MKTQIYFYLLTDYLFSYLIIIIEILLVIVPILLAVAYFTLAERKILAAIQRRRGPNVIGLYGLLQPLSDGLKLVFKELLSPANSFKNLFLASPLITFIVSLLSWVVVSFDKGAQLTSLELSHLYIFSITSLGIYGVIMSGWSSNSKYAFLGSLRSTAQMVSYEVSMGFMITTVAICSGSYNIETIINSQQDVWFVIPMFPLALIFFIACLAETNRHPFDLPEAEAELVSGYNVEYSSMGFGLFSLGEYSNMLLFSYINSVLFFGGWLSPISLLSIIPGYFWCALKIVIFVFIFVWARAALPRYRYDQLMDLGWKCILPLSLAYLLLTSSVLMSFNLFPC